MYGSHSSSRPSGQQNLGPSQPEWRLPSTSTSQQQPPRQPSPAAAPSPPPPPSYNPNIYGPMSGQSPVPSASAGVSPVTGKDTASWGVRFNRHHIHAPPPLPPRPSSTPGNAPPKAHSPLLSPSDSSNPAPAAPVYGPPSSAVEHHQHFQQQWPVNAPYAPQQSGGSIPPPPPPIPPGYQNGFSQHPSPPPYSTFGHPHDSQSMNFEQSNPYPRPEQTVSQLRPSEQTPAAPVSPATYGASPMTAPPVPPKTSHNIIPSSASAIGPATPSDWEHLSPTPGNIDDVNVFAPRQDTIAHANTTSQPPTAFPTAPPNTTPYQPAISTPPPKVSPTFQPTPAQDNAGMQNRFTESPVSPNTVQDPHEPSRPTRVDSDDSAYSAAESIDGVIDAWNQPVSAEPENMTAQADHGTGPRTGLPSPMQRLSPLEIPKPKSETTVPQEKKAESNIDATQSSNALHENTSKALSPQSKPLNPYEDLDPWSKSSLERYVAMLRKEAVADSDVERFKIFTAFMSKETKLREILYNIEHEDEPIARQSTPSLPSSIKKSEHEDKPIARQSTPAPSSSVKKPDENTSFESGLIPVETETEGDHMMAAENSDPEDGGKYSPGGRPIIPSLHTPTTPGLQRSASNPPGPKNSSGQDRFSRSTSVPPSNNSATHKQDLSPLTTNPPQPIYTPFRYMEGPQRGSDHLAIELPAYQAYSALRQASAESGRVMSNALTSNTEDKTSPSPSVQTDHDETFIGLIREKSIAYRKKAPRRSSSPPPLPMSLRQGRPAGLIDDLRSMVSSPLAKQSESAWHITTRKDLEKYSNDFGYIREALKSWETTSQSRRESLDKERMRRQEESEKHVDALFNDKEIGYADINILEEEFRQTEARVQLDEEREEFERFVATVFNPLDERLKNELSTLGAQYESALGQLDHENSRIKDSITDKYNLSHTMKAVTQIYQKLEVRYQKRLDIALDRERRRKKTERRPLVFMGDSPALKRLDADFDRMERQNILEAAKHRDERANRLMDSFDDAIMHGLGENQSLLDEVSAKVSRIDSATVHSSGMAGSEIEQLMKSVYNLVSSLREDSESILHNFGIADSALNDADYSVSVAEARYSNSDGDVFEQLDDEKKKEDAKIQNDLKSKLESVRAGPASITTMINDILRSLDKAPMAEPPALSDDIPNIHPIDSLLPGPRPPTTTPRKPEVSEHQERLRKALDDAKKRNAAKNQA